MLGPSVVVAPAIPGQQSQQQSQSHDAAAADAKVETDLQDLGLEYGRYLQQVVSALEADPEFSAKLENASLDSIKSGAIADQLHFVDH